MARAAADRANPVLRRDMCIIAGCYPLLGERRNLLPRKADTGSGQEEEEEGDVEVFRKEKERKEKELQKNRERCAAYAPDYSMPHDPDADLSAAPLAECEADAQCTIDKQSLTCKPRSEYLDVERGDTFESCGEEVEFVERWRTLAFNCMSSKKLDKQEPFDWRRQGQQYTYIAHSVVGGVNGALLRTVAGDRYYMFVGYGHVMPQRRLDVVRPSVEAFAKECLARAGGKPLVLYGHSMGGQVVSDYVLHNLPRLRKQQNVVVIISGAPPFQEDHGAKMDRIVAALSMDRFFNLAAADDLNIDSRVTLHPSLRLVLASVQRIDSSGRGWTFTGCCDGKNRHPNSYYHDFRVLFPAGVKPIAKTILEIKAGGGGSNRGESTPRASGKHTSRQRKSNGAGDMRKRGSANQRRRPRP